MQSIGSFGVTGGSDFGNACETKDGGGSVVVAVGKDRRKSNQPKPFIRLVLLGYLAGSDLGIHTKRKMDVGQC